MRKAYAVILLDVLDHERYVEYARLATEIESEYGARPLVAGDASRVIEGTGPAERVVILEFPSLEQARGWYSDPRYQEIVPLRHEATRSSILFIEAFG
jgi:uncharacterized protein (DUF1330 family)